MQSSSAGTPDLARHLELKVRTQERQLVTVPLAVVALAIGMAAPRFMRRSTDR